MVGTTLYPMNALEATNPELYKLYKDGYEGREQLLERTIPYLDCLWNDVLHCSPVHPHEIIKALKAAGVKEIPELEYFQIDTGTDIDMSKAVIFYRDSNTAGDIRFQKASEADWSQVAVIPPITLEHYKNVAENGEPLFAYHGIPHFLYLGDIATADLQRIT